MQEKQNRRVEKMQEHECVEFTPFGDRVLVKQDGDGGADDAHGHISIPDSQKEPPLEGTVLRTGAGRWAQGVLEIPEAEEGDRVLFGRYAGTPIWVDGREYLLLRDEEILGRRHRPEIVVKSGE